MTTTTMTLVSAEAIKMVGKMMSTMKILNMEVKTAPARENANVETIPIQCSIQMAPHIRATKVMISLNNQPAVEIVVQTLKSSSQTNYETITHSSDAHLDLARPQTATTLRLVILRHLRIAMKTLLTRKV